MTEKDKKEVDEIYEHLKAKFLKDSESGWINPKNFKDCIDQLEGQINDLQVAIDSIRDRFVSLCKGNNVPATSWMKAGRYFTNRED